MAEGGPRTRWLGASALQMHAEQVRNAFPINWLGQSMAVDLVICRSSSAHQWTLLRVLRLFALLPVEEVSGFSYLGSRL